jgi:hypothetical protein
MSKEISSKLILDPIFRKREFSNGHCARGANDRVDRNDKSIDFGSCFSQCGVIAEINCDKCDLDFRICGFDLLDYGIDFGLVAADENDVRGTCCGEGGGYFCAEGVFAGTCDEN